MAENSNAGEAKRLLLAVGPGILMAGAAIGVSHLVQATRAGADYGFSLLWLLILAVLSKYPFMEFGPRFAAATGNNLVTGYRQMGSYAYWIYVAITVGTMFIIQAAVTVVTAGLAEQLFNLGLSPVIWSAAILVVCIALLFLGHYPVLDFTMKFIISVLTICTVIAVIMALAATTTNPVATPTPPSYWNRAGISFAIAFMGWMPIPLDASIWHSIWTGERTQQTHYRPTLKEANFDFNLGYLSAGFIGLLFFLLGALVMFGSGESFSNNSVEFSVQVIKLYSQTLGEWSVPVISVAALVTMFSTTLAVTDAYPRVMSALWRERQEQLSEDKSKTVIYRLSLLVIPGVALLILIFLAGQAFTVLIDFASGLSFLAAPILGWFNLKLVSGKWMPKEARPRKPYRYFSWLCLIWLVVFTLIWFYWQFFS
ncbi:NRAMP family divalent metal transporter [Dactylococcopsis salina]|uniref:Mn2+/Fe2_transporter, NRAMP family n=1 Tax=Dactylococcopsis salina (strain PCC 8305) TaxID=13035 RepID=K9YTZ7_DACS8|nr:divalent metal cation transporter [Dactylococcopsis salina]AFZ49815.1 Mn2+/Fe2_ transporter, NRAMP family [Dactylococcopsis salina PCC 8305]